MHTPGAPRPSSALSLHAAFFRTILHLISGLLVFGMMLSPAQAQTAFGYVPRSLGSGLVGPAAVAADTTNGLVYVGNRGGSTVSVIDPVANTIVSTISVGHTPNAIAVSTTGKIYVANSDSNSVSVIDSTSNTVIATVPVGDIPVGIGVSGAGPAAGDIYVANEGSNTVSIIDPTSNTVIATVAVGNAPQAIAVSSAGSTAGDVYVANYSSGTVSVIDPASNTVITTVVVGNGPSGIAVDATSGQIYVSNNLDFNVSVIDPATNVVTTTIPTGAAPEGVAADATSGLIYVANTASASITVINPATNVAIATIPIGNGPYFIAPDSSGNLYVGDLNTTTVQEILFRGANLGAVAIATSTPATQTLIFHFTAGGSIQVPQVLTQGAPSLDFTDAGTGTCTTTNGISHPYSAGSSCTVVVKFAPKFAGQRYGAVVLPDINGNSIATAYLYGSGDGPQVAFAPPVQSTISGGVNAPQGVAVDGSGNLYFSNSQSDTVIKVTPAGVQSTLPLTGLASPYGMVVDASGNLYIADAGTGTVQKMTPAGVQSTLPLTGVGAPSGVTVDGAGNLYIARLNNEVLKVTPAGVQSTLPFTGLNTPTGVAVDGSGNIYISNDNGNNVLKLTPAGVQSTVPFTGLSNPEGVAVDGIGNVYISNAGTKTLLKVTPAGVQSTVPTTGMSVAYGVAVDASGNIYIANTFGNNALKLDYADAPTVSFATPTVDGTPDSADGAEMVSLLNIGTQPLSIVIPASGNNPSMLAAPDFSLNSTGGTKCPLIASTASSAGSVPAGGNCDLTLSFAPVATPIFGGALSETMIIADNSLNAAAPNYTTQSITLKGTAQAAGPYFTVTGLDPFPFYTSTPITITAHNIDGTVDTGYTGTFTLTSSDPGFGNVNCATTLVSGTETCNIVLKTAGTDTVTASDTASGFLPGILTTAVFPGAPTSFGISAPSSAVAGTPISVTVTGYDLFGNVTTNYTGTINFSSMDAAAVLPANYTFVSGDAGSHTFSVTLKTPGTQFIEATDTTIILSGFSGHIAVTAPNLVVTTTADDAGTAGNCTLQLAASTGTDHACSLRDALLEAALLGSGNISFDATKFAAAQTITLINGAMPVPANAFILGPGADKLIVNANSASGSIFTVNSGVTATISGMELTGIDNSAGTSAATAAPITNLGSLTLNAVYVTGNNGSFGSSGTGSTGGGIYSNGTLNITNSTIAGNHAQNGGGIYANSGTCTITNSTIAGNIVSSGGGGIYAAGSALTLSSDTITSNTASGTGGVYAGAALTVTNTLIGGNHLLTLSSYPDLHAAGGIITNDGGNFYEAVSDPSATIIPVLSSLGSYGGTMQTVLPLPGSPLICNGVTSSLTTDQRSAARSTTYGSTSCVDIGAVQTHYALSFTQDASNVVQFASMSPSPAVAVTENGAPFTVEAVAVPLTMTTGAGTLTGGSVSTSTTTGVATYSALSVDTPGAADQLTASLSLGSSESITALSSIFTVASAATQLGFGTTIPSTANANSNLGSVQVAVQGTTNNTITNSTASVTLVLTGPAGFTTVSPTANAASGIATFDLSGAALTPAGTYTLTATSGSLTQASATITVNKLTDTINFTAPATPVTYGVSPITLVATGGGSSSPVVLSIDGSSTATGVLSGSTLTVTSAGTFVIDANQAGDSNYNAATQAQHTIVVSQASTLTTVAQTAPATAGVGTGVNTTFTATIAGTPGTPAGTVQFYDNGTAIGSPVTLTGGVATLTTTFSMATTHLITAIYSGDANFLASTSDAFNEVVSTPGYTVSANPNSLTITRGTTVTLSITLIPTGNYTGTASFSCGNLPQFVSCAFTPSSVAFNGTNTPQMVAVTIYTLGPANTKAAKSPAQSAMIWFGGLLLGGLLMLRRKKIRSLSLLGLMMLMLTGVTMLSGCGSGRHYYSQTGTSQVSINVTGMGTGSSGNVDQSAAVSLTIQ